MLVDDLNQILRDNKVGRDKDFVRNLLKERLQLYILNFVYSKSSFNKLIFTGGTALRRFYNLPRLSEDLDFDFEENFLFDGDQFSKELKEYFVKEIQFKEVETKFNANGNILFVRFPVLETLGFSGGGNSNVLFVRCDFSKNLCPIFETENKLLSTDLFIFIVRGYDLSTLFANKLVAFLNRDFKRGGEQKVAFKGRDVFDISWLVGQSMQRNWSLKANWGRASTLSGFKEKEKFIGALREKMEKIDGKDLKRDLEPFIADQSFLNGFTGDFRNFIIPYLNDVL